MSNLEDPVFDDPEPPPVYLVGEAGPELIVPVPRLVEDEEDYT